MTKEMRDLLVDQLDAAKTSEEIDRAMVGGMKAMVDCQFKTSERVKSIAAEREAEKNRREGAKWLWGVLASIASAGGGAVILKLLAACGGAH
jgi:hypothetical protein